MLIASISSSYHNKILLSETLSKRIGL